ncbi:hypothetical protein HY249_02460 [Candidatus Azambacteria bacterium]|nr:hypothetical protein [Candidatus Azambacteria bacterium]
MQKETGLNFLDPAVDGSMLKETASSIDDFWISIFGTALRGLLPRESDRDISLMTVGTEESFKKRKLMSYMFLWGDISSVVVIFFSLLFAGSLFFMNMLLTDTKVKFSQLQVGSTARSETETLIAESEKFNTLVSRTLEIQTNKFELKKIMEDVSAVLPQESIKPLSFEMASPDGMIILRVIAKDSKAAFELRDNLKNSGKFYDIKMPVLGIDQRSNIAITISFKIL